jgi:hypothetical protein
VGVAIKLISNIAHIAAPSTGVKGYKGVLKGRTSPGSVMRK